MTGRVSSLPSSPGTELTLLDTRKADITTANQLPLWGSQGQAGCFARLQIPLLGCSIRKYLQASWLGRQGSNLGMSVPKTDALPLGDAPTCGVFSRCLWGPQEAFPEK